MKLRNTILITTILITTGIVLILGGVSGRQFERMLTKRMVRDYQETVNTMKKNVETVVAYTEDFTKYISLDDTVLETILEYQNAEGKQEVLNRLAMKQKWDGFSNQLIFSTSMIYSLEIYSGDAIIYSYYDDPAVSNMKNIPDDIIEEAISQSPPIWTNLLTLKQHRSYKRNPDYGFAVVKSVRNEMGKNVGAIAVYVRESSFSEILEAVGEEQKSRCYLVDKDNLIISAVEKEELYQEIQKTLGLTGDEYEKCLRDGVFLKEHRGEEPLLYVSRSIGTEGINLVCETTMNELSRQQRESWVFMGVIMVLTVVLAVISAWYLSRRITKPLGELMGVMEQIKEDEKSIHLRFSEKDTGEIGVLGKRFNELMDELDASMQQIYEEQRQRRHNEVRLLQAQIVPHFLYNTMGIISSFIRLGMPDKALAAIQNLVSFYRLSLSLGKDVITLKEEMELTKNYIELQKLRYIEYMEYEIAYDDTVGNVWIPKLTIQPLVENVLHHGLKPEKEKCMISIGVKPEEDGKRLKISVYDNGVGIKKERLWQLRESLERGKSVTESFGIFNVDQRLKLMYEKSYHMEIDSVEGEYTQFVLWLPIQSKNEGTEHV